jgi:hypothetical protein
MGNHTCFAFPDQVHFCCNFDHEILLRAYPPLWYFLYDFTGIVLAIIHIDLVHFALRSSSKPSKLHIPDLVIWLRSVRSDESSVMSIYGRHRCTGLHVEGCESFKGPLVRPFILIRDGFAGERQLLFRERHNILITPSTVQWHHIRIRSPHYGLVTRPGNSMGVILE